MKKFLKIISPILVLVVSIGIVQALGAAKPEPEKKEEAQRLISLYVDEVKSDTVTISVQTQGEVRPKTEIDLIPQVSGRIVAISEAFADASAEANQTGDNFVLTAVIMASVLPIHDYNKDQHPRLERSPQRPPATILQLNDWIQRYCRTNGHLYLDYFTAMVDPNGFLKNDLADDGLHPNAAGYRVMAPLVQQAIYKVVPRGGGPRRR